MVAQELRGGETASNTTDAAATISTFTKIRTTIFPIYGNEVKKFLLIGSIKFFIIMALTLTRDTKDTLVVTQCGAEAIAFLKVRTCVMMLLNPIYKYMNIFQVWF
jgi:AAA family ATP:ADP antiporter